MLIPYDQLSPETLQSLLENYALREGTEYGEQDISLQTKVDRLLSQLDSGRICIVFDAITETCDVLTQQQFSDMQNSNETAYEAGE